MPHTGFAGLSIKISFRVTPNRIDTESSRRHESHRNTESAEYRSPLLRLTKVAGIVTGRSTYTGQ